MILTLKIIDVDLKPERWYNGLIYPGIIHKRGDLIFKLNDSIMRIIKCDAKLDSFYEIGTNFCWNVIVLLMKFYMEDPINKLNLELYFNTTDEKYTLSIPDPNILLYVEHGNQQHKINFKICGIDKIHRLYLSMVLMRDYPTTVNSGIIYYHLLTDKYKQILYSQELKNMMIESKEIIYDHEKSMAYLSNFLKPMKINLKTLQYSLVAPVVLPIDLLNLVFSYHSHF